MIMAQRGQSAPDASRAGFGTRVASALGPRPAPGARLWLCDSALWGPPIFPFVTICVLLLVPAGSAPTPQQVEVHRLRAAAQRSVHTPWKGLCPPGTHISEDGRNCTQCQSGVEYTSHSNTLSSCLRCTVCKSDEDEISPCVRTRDTQCHCKPGTFRGKDALEFCQKCKTGCPNGMVEASPCTPWGDLECVHRSSGTKGTGEATVSGEQVDSGPGSPASPSPPSGALIIVIVVVGLMLLLACVVGLLWKKGTFQGCGERSKCMARVMMRKWRVPRGPEAEQNVHNQLLSPSQPTLGSAQENQGQEQAELPGAVAPNPVEAEPLLRQVKAQSFQMRRMEPDPANGANPTETLKSLFNDLPDLVPFNSWTRVMRLLGLTDNEIEVANACAVSPEDGFYRMLVKWLNKKGRDASINSLLDALETLGERNAKEGIQDYLVSSGKYIYQEYTADNLGYVHGNEMMASGNQASLVDFAT